MHSKARGLADYFMRISSDRSAFAFIFCGLAIAVFLILSFRNIGLNPGVFADEWIYSSSSRLFDISRSAIPSYLFLLIFEHTSRCGGAFLECARLMNAAFIMLAMPFIYLVARRYANRWVSLFIATLTALGPIGSYSTYFMPETLYFLGFWIFVWYTLSAPALLKPLQYAVLVGIILGLMMTIKFHAFFLLAGFCAFLALCVIIPSIQLHWRKGLKIACITISATLLTRFAFGYLVAGRAGLSLTGSFYGNIAGSTLDWHRLFELIPLTLKVAANHLLALSMLFAVPIATLLAQPQILTTPPDTEQSGVATGRLPLLPLLTAMLVVMLGVTSLFSAMVAGQTLYESLDRVHMRYYDFIFPLFSILAAAQISAPKDIKSTHLRTTLAGLLVGLLAIYTLLVGMYHFIPNHVDHPDLRGFMAHPAVCMTLGCMGLFALLIWSYRRRRGAQIFVFLFLPMSLLSSSYVLSHIQGMRMASDKYDRAGEFAKLYLADQGAGLVIAGSDPSTLIQTQFHVDNPDVQVSYIWEGNAVTESHIPSDSTWLLIFDDYEIQVPTYWTVDMGEYKLLRLTPDHLIDFKATSWPGVLGMVRGLSHAEAFGRWSNAKVVELGLLTPVNGTVQLTLEARAFGPNAGQPFTLSLGKQEQSFILQETGQQKVSLTFHLIEPAHKIRILIPQPTSPQELGLGNDGRPLGIALHQLHLQKTGEIKQAN